MGEMISIPRAGGSFGAYMARPEAEKAPGLVVIQEIFGVNQVMRDLTDRFARAGFLAVCPDLFWRIEPGIDITDKSEAEMTRAFELFNAFDVDKGVKDIGATIARVRRDKGCSGPVGSVGFCLGGLLAFLTATRTDIDAAVGYYGVGIEQRLREADALVTPLLLHIAEEDRFVPKAAQSMIIEALKNRSLVELFTYPGCDHAFARPGGEHYDEEAATRAETRTLAFLRARLAR
ncbi:MAG: dienelactone hydrolase family protein [Caulobacteraceae bacterium]